jgi:predicted metal-binding membrane protein
MSDGVLEVVLRRDRIVVTIALVVLTALAWGYVLWLAVDMDMGGMDMTGFRMIPAGIGIMAPANAPWMAPFLGCPLGLQPGHFTAEPWLHLLTLHLLAAGG